MTRKMNSSSVKFPLPDGYFPPVKLTPAEVEVYERRVEIIMKNALAEYNLHEAMGAPPDYGSRWSVIGSVEHLTAIREVDPSRAVESSRVFGRIDGDYRNFLDFHYSVTAQEVFAVNQFKFGYAVDAAVLCNIHTKESNKPHLYLGMKWVCLDPSTLSRKRDMCFLEYLVFTKDLQGRDVGVRITLPLQLEECPPLPDKLKTRRIHSHTVTIVRPTTDSADTTEIFATSEIDMFKGSSLSSVATFKKLMTTLSSMALYADSKKISTYGILDRSSWAPKKARTNCSVCSRKFSTTRRRQHCRLCGEVACRRCMTVRDAPMLDDNATSTQRTFQVVKTTFCKACMGRIRGSEVSSIAGIDSQDEGFSDAESMSWFPDRSQCRSLDNDTNFTMTGGSSVASPSTIGPNTALSIQDIAVEDSESEDNGYTLQRKQGKFSSSIGSEVCSETKTSVSSSLDEETEIEEVTEPAVPVMIDLRHLRTMAGAERVVQEAEEAEMRTMRESLAALDFKAVRLANSPSSADKNAGTEGFSSNRSGKPPPMEEDDDDDDVIEVIDEPNQIVSTSRQIVSSPLNESSMDQNALADQVLFGSNRSIDQCLQEQEVLLKRLVMAANSSSGYYPPSARSQQSFEP